jgi:hypothetical protein
MMTTTETNTLTRREALRSALHGSITAALIPPLGLIAETKPSPKPEPEFVPTNDYPFFEITTRITSS